MTDPFRQVFRDQYWSRSAYWLQRPLQALPLMQRPPQTKHSVSVALQGLDAVALAGRKVLA